MAVHPMSTPLLPPSAPKESSCCQCLRRGPADSWRCSAGRAKQALRPAAGGAVAGVLTVSRAVSFALVLSHARPELKPAFGIFLQSLLLSTILSQAAYSIFHTLPWAIACPSSTAVPFNAQLVQIASATALAGGQMHATSIAVIEGAAVYGLVALACSSMVFSCFLLLSTLTAGAADRLDAMKGSFPQPLVLSLFASVGVSMVQSARELAAGAGAWQLADPKLACALVSGLLMRMISRSKCGQSALTLPLLLVGQIILFWVLAVAFVGRASVEQTAREAGWLFDEFPPCSLQHFLHVWSGALNQQSWHTLVTDVFRSRILWTRVLTLIPVLVLDLLTGTVVPLEQTAAEMLACQQEMRIAAMTNLMAAGVGGGASYASLSPSRLCLEVGGATVPSAEKITRLISGLASVLIPAVALTPLGQAGVARCPRFVVAGLLIHLGLGYLLEGLWDSRRLLAALAPVEYVVIFVTVMVSLWVGFPQAILLGLLLLSFLFVLRYGQSEVVQFACSARELPSLRSRRYRTADEWDTLQPMLSRIFVVRVNSSHLFFGSVSAILAAASPCIQADSSHRRFLVLDLSAVRTLDSSALSALTRVPGTVTVLMVELKAELVKSLREASALKSLRCFEDMDIALECCEDQLLREVFDSPGSFRKDVPLCVPAGEGTLSSNMMRELAETKLPAPLPQQSVKEILSAALPGASNMLLQTLLNGRHSSRLAFVRGSVISEAGSRCAGMIVCLQGVFSIHTGSVRLPEVVHETIGIDVLAKGLVGPRNLSSGNEQALADLAIQHGLCRSGNSSKSYSVGPGYVCGEASLMVAQLVKQPVSLVAETACECLHVQRELMLVLEAAVPTQSLALELHQVLARRLCLEKFSWTEAPITRSTSGLA